MRNWREIPIPARLAKRPRDPRGYPIPASVSITSDGKAHFTINDAHKVRDHLANQTCALCGEKLYPKRQWLIGGPSVAFHEHGAYLDTPSHEECARYAIAVCPYLALPNYRNRIDDKTVDYASTDNFVVIKDESIADDRPEIFVLTCTDRISIVEQGIQLLVVPRRPWKVVEFWQNGERIGDELGLTITEKILKELQ